MRNYKIFTDGHPGKLSRTGSLDNQYIYARQLKGPHSALLKVYNISFQNSRLAAGRMVVVNPKQCSIKLFVDPAMLSYDFSKFNVNPNPPLGFSHQPMAGKTLKEIVSLRKNVVFACNGHFDNLWSANSVQIVDSQIIKRQAPGIGMKKTLSLNGYHTIFSFEPGNLGIRHVQFKDNQMVKCLNNGKASSLPTQGIAGPLLIEGQRRMDGFLRSQFPNTKPDHLLWDPQTGEKALSAVGKNYQGELVFVSAAGNSAIAPEIRIKELVDLLMAFEVVEAILLGASNEVQQYVKLSETEALWLIGKPQKNSTMPPYPDGRPLSSAIIVTQ